MSTYEFENVTIFEATVTGHLENGPPITMPPPNWWPLRDRVYDAARAVVAFPREADFHLVYRHSASGQLSRTRWVVTAELLGPTLLWHEDISGESAMMFRLIQRHDVQQLRDDLDRPNPWFALQDVIAAALGKQALGVGPVEIPLPGHEVMVFTPELIHYTRGVWNPVHTPSADHVFGWTFSAEPTDPHEPAIWLVPAGQSNGMKLSVCTDRNGEAWSDLTEPCPSFEPIPPPPSAGPA